MGHMDKGYRNNLWDMCHGHRGFMGVVPCNFERDFPETWEVMVTLVTLYFA